MWFCAVCLEEQLCLLKWAFILCWSPSSISRDVLGEFFPWVDDLSFVSKCQRSGWLDPSSPEILSTSEESLEHALNLIFFFHYSSHYGMMEDRLAIELQWLKQAFNFPILQVSLLLNVSLIWHGDLDTWVGFFKCLALKSRASQTGLSQDCLLACLRIGWYWGGVL